jgi:secondary thiamine-phosphate synthase enzyme
MKTANKILEYQTKKEFDFIDITEEVKKFVKEESQIKNGFINIQTLHTTAAIILNENEPLLLEDIKKNLERLSPGNIKYKHDDFTTRTVNMCPDECANGRSHCKAIYLPVNITLNLIDGKIQLGQWQSIMLLELDRSRSRKVQIQVIGE